MKKAFIAALFIIISLALAIAGTVLIPGMTGLYLGTALIALNLLCLLFPKKKSNDPGRPVLMDSK
jgi:hypothetical protein